MALTYQTGTVVGGSALLAALVTFLTTNCGATVLDTLSTNDKVLTWTGTDGRKKYLRLTTTGDAGNPVKYGKERWRDGLIARLYANWNTGTHSGTMRAGRWGPILGQSSNTAAPSIAAARLSDNDAYPVSSSGVALGLTLNGRIGGLIGNRVLYGTGLGTQTLIGFTDIVSGETWNSSVWPDGGATSSCQPCYVLSPDGKEHLYFIGVAGTHFWRYDIDTNTWNQLADMPWAAGSTGGGFCLYDGNDTIYAARGSNSTSFAKYTISTNTWTALTALPVARGAGFSSQNVAVYVPASASGLSSDQLVFPCALSSSTFYRYDVNAGTFTAITAPANFGSSGNISTMAFDDSKFIYFLETTSSCWSMDVTTLGAPVFVANPFLNGAIASNFGSEVFRQLSGVVFCDPSLNTTYYFLGDADSLFVGTAENGRNHWLHAGLYDSYRGASFTTTTGVLAAGFQVSVPVVSSSGYAQGDIVDLVNADGTNWELVTITSVPDATHVVVNVTKSHTTGALLGRDVLSFVVTGGSGLACTPRDGQGYQTDYVAPSWNLRPAFAQQALNNTAPGGDKYFQQIPLMITGPPFSGPANNLTFGSGSLNANLGTIRNVFAFGVSGSAPPSSGQQVIGIDGKTYVALRPNSEYPFGAGAVAGHGILIGPIN
jgi:hypothetical protein